LSESVKQTMTDQAKRQRAAYYREWRRRNPGKASEYQKRYWERKSRAVTSEEAPNGEKTVRENG